MFKTSFTATGIAIVAAAFLSAGCTKTLKKESVEALIKTNADKVGLKLKAVTCPGGRQAKAGDAFDCTGELDGGGKATFKIKQKDDKGGLELELEGAFLSETAVATAVGGEFGGKADAKCGSKQAVIKKGETYSCDLTGPGGKGKIVYTNADGKKVSGQLTMEGQPPKAEQEPAGAEMPTESGEAAEE